MHAQKTELLKFTCDKKIKLEKRRLKEGDYNIFHEVGEKVMEGKTKADCILSPLEAERRGKMIKLSRFLDN